MYSIRSCYPRSSVKQSLLRALSHFLEGGQIRLKNALNLYLTYGILITSLLKSFKVLNLRNELKQNFLGLQFLWGYP